MKVLLIGLPYFAQKLARNLSDIDRDNAYIPLNPSDKYIDRLRYLAHLPSADTVYVIGASVVPGRSLKAALYLNKRIVLHWVGTDVLNACDASSEHKVNQNLIIRSTHLCEVAWIQRELSEIGIIADIAQIACFDNDLQPPKPLPERFIILSYVGKGNEISYGISELIQLAKDFPHIEIRIAGISEYSCVIPNNLKLLGWVDNMAAQYDNCTLYLRLPKHDGLSFSVLEALAHGRYVGYSQDYNKTYYVPTYTDIKTLVIELAAKHGSRSLERNIRGFEYVRDEYKKDYVMRGLSSKLLKIKPR